MFNRRRNLFIYAVVFIVIRVIKGKVKVITQRKRQKKNIQTHTQTKKQIKIKGNPRPNKS